MTGPSNDPIDPSTSAPRQRRAPKGEKRREELLDAALQLFSLEGYSGSSIARIAQIVGISVAGVLHHFPNKIALLTGVLTRRDEVSQKIADELRIDNTLKGFLGGLQAINRSNATAPGVVRAFSILNAESLVEGHPAWEWYQARYARIHASMLGRLRQLVVVGEVRADVDLNLIIQQCLAMMDGLQLQWLRFPQSVDLVASFDDWIVRLEAAIRA
ncbi:TetR/AcrR family transcriptional regulator [Pseudomonas sp.]|uniref:TetR/AcrR family transcriptional regulator n=1 Tax=Pseudomonas sp. TaxID=306 RepID=UPI00260AF595|nr:TetR/AcrR family transcriptional regulator [Pseudomonas sp.]